LSYPTNSEIEKAADIISRLPKGFLPYPLFMAIASKVVTPTLELVICQRVNNELKVLLTRRPDNDTYWPGEWHIPGTVIRATDNEHTFRSCFDRILRDELHDLVTITDPAYVSTEFWDIERGREVDQLFCAWSQDVYDLPDDIKFFSIKKLPEPFMKNHIKIVAKIEQYINKKGN
jgi:hypothetical protein